MSRSTSMTLIGLALILATLAAMLFAPDRWEEWKDWAAPLAAAVAGFLIAWKPKAAMLLLALLPVACATLSAEQEYKIASDSYSRVVAVVTAASRAGMISLDDLEDFNEVREQANIELDAMRDALDEGYDIEYIKRRFDALLDRMLMYEENIDAGGLDDSQSSAGSGWWCRGRDQGSAGGGQGSLCRRAGSDRPPALGGELRFRSGTGKAA